MVIQMLVNLESTCRNIYRQMKQSECLASVGDGIQIDDIEVNITAEQMTKLANELYKGYQNYASVNGKPDPSKMGEQVIKYLGTEDGKKRLADGLTKTVDMNALESQVSAAMQDYMTKAMGVLSNSMGEAIGTQVSSAMAANRNTAYKRY